MGFDEPGVSQAWLGQVGKEDQVMLNVELGLMQELGGVGLSVVGWGDRLLVRGGRVEYGLVV